MSQSSNVSFGVREAEAPIVAFVDTILGPIPKPPQGLERVTVLDYKTAC